MQSVQKAYNELCYYTLSHKDPAFIHQHVVDAFTAQTVNENTKPIAAIFALAGLYLYLEKKFTGKQVQHMHMVMAKVKRAWPEIYLPEDRGGITVFDVLQTSPGKERDEIIRKWCIVVWNAHSQNHKKVEELVNEYLS